MIAVGWKQPRPFVSLSLQMLVALLCSNEPQKDLCLRSGWHAPPFWHVTWPDNVKNSVSHQSWEILFNLSGETKKKVAVFPLVSTVFTSNFNKERTFKYICAPVEENTWQNNECCLTDSFVWAINRRHPVRLCYRLLQEMSIFGLKW